MEARPKQERNAQEEVDTQKSWKSNTIPVDSVKEFCTKKKESTEIL